ncbi:MAG: ABC transporter permease, partial [Frisingicoccus sp.]|nr:ABC transporter permease [Frisingicoccus sp.]
MTDKKEKVIQGLVIALITIAVGTVLIMMSNANPAEAYANFFKGIFGNLNGFCEVFVKATPLIFTGLGCAVAFRTGFFNIGAEGQFYVGALTASMVALNIQGAAGIVLALAAGFLAGGVWALIAAVFKAKLGISEIIVTIMLNYIAINLVGIAVRTFLMDPAGSVPQSAKFDSSVWLPQLLPPTRLHAGFILALVSVAVVWFLLEKTTVGYEIKVVGFNKRAAACNGISVMKNIVISAFLSGGLAGMAGVVEVLAIQKKLLEGISSNCGYTAVLIALMAGNHPVGVIVASVAMA